MKTGTWEGMTGTITATRADIASIIAAAPALPDPVIKIGHDDPRFSGSPSLGRIVNLRTADQGNTLIGDLVDMPQWLVDAAPKHFAQRSIEAVSNFVSNGNVYRMVLTGLALLGASLPAVTDLDSLQDLLERTA